MIGLLAKLWIKEEDDQMKVRQSYGMLCWELC